MPISSEEKTNWNGSILVQTVNDVFSKKGIFDENIVFVAIQFIINVKSSTKISSSIFGRSIFLASLSTKKLSYFSQV